MTMLPEYWRWLDGPATVPALLTSQHAGLARGWLTSVHWVIKSLRSGTVEVPHLLWTIPQSDYQLGNPKDCLTFMNWQTQSIISRKLVTVRLVCFQKYLQKLFATLLKYLEWPSNHFLLRFEIIISCPRQHQLPPWCHWWRWATTLLINQPQHL